MTLVGLHVFNIATSLLVYCGTFEKFWSFIRIKEITNRGAASGVVRGEHIV